MECLVSWFVATDLSRSATAVSQMSCHLVSAFCLAFYPPAIPSQSKLDRQLTHILLAPPDPNTR